MLVGEVEQPEQALEILMAQLDLVAVLEIMVVVVTFKVVVALELSFFVI
jgi:hypothetical protein